MTVAQGINTTVSRVKQSALGSPGSTGSKLVRRVTLDLNKTAETYRSNEIASHQQSTGATEGPSQVGGSLNGEMSPGTYSLEYAAILRRDFATAFTAITSVALTIAGSGPTYTVTRGSGSFLTDGVKKGMVVRLTVGTLNAANISKNLLVIGVTGTVLTVKPLNNVALVAEGPIAGCTVSAPGKETHAPTSGHTDDYFSWEKKFNDLTRYELFTDVKPGSVAVAVPATGIATNNFTMVGLGRALSASETLTSPTSETTSAVLTAVQGAVVVNGVITPVTGMQFTIDGVTTAGEAEVGSGTLSDLQRGRIAITGGSFTAKFSAATLQLLRDAQTVVTVIAALADSGSAIAEFITFTFPAAKIMTDTADDGEKAIIRTYGFEPQYNGAGGAGTDSHQTICQIHDSLAA